MICKDPGVSRISRKQPDAFYVSVLRSELGCGAITTDDRVLVACGGDLDRVCLMEAGFSDVVISNLDSRGAQDDYDPYVWLREDAEDLSAEDGSYDVVIVHSGLHHCYNPYRALGELCRVARKLVIAFEPYDTWFTQAGTKFGYGQQYEDCAVHGNQGKHGGVANGEIPNFVYRFREAEIEKFAAAFFPYGMPTVHFYRALRVNAGRFSRHRSAWLRGTFRLAYPLIQGLARMIPSLNNNLCWTIRRPALGHYHQWIGEVDGTPRVDKEYLLWKYGPFPK